MPGSPPRLIDEKSTIVIAIYAMICHFHHEHPLAVSRFSIPPAAPACFRGALMELKSLLCLAAMLPLA
ncbi:hypothetical protein, partial [Pseudogulbenkiania ferrooxidans]|uniref:hypothetical protein n=1 Tax=Pseudogulbenkiania ferrooxidans TaxID=549169 RepID=UPI002570D4BD